MIEIDSTPATGSCTAVAERARAFLMEAGYAPSDAEIILAPNLPKDGNLAAKLTGTDPASSPILLLAHIDVVNTDAQEWKHDPFKLIEENGYFHGRGTVDDKAMAAIFVDTLMRFKAEHFAPRHTLRLALTCGEESGGRLRGVRYLADKRPETVKAAFALNEGASGSLDAAAKPLILGIEAGQKVYQDFKLTVTGPGGHSSRPEGASVITRLADALARLGHYQFAPLVSPVTRGYFTRSAALQQGTIAADMKAVGAGSSDAATLDRLSAADPLWNAMIRTTCVATIVDSGNSKASIPLSATANVNCRILPGQSVADVRHILTEAIGDPSIALDTNSHDLTGITAPTPPMPPALLAAIEKAAAMVWPGVPVVPAIGAGASDGRFLNASGTPTFGVSGLFVDPDGNGVHGLDERLRVRSLLDARTFQYRLIKQLAAQGDRP